MLGSNSRTAGIGGGSRFGFLLLALAGLPLAVQDATAQAPTTTYTPAQANAGAAVYQARCAMCHLPTLAGSPMAPALAGPVFRSAWGARPVAQLMDRITTSMPPNAVGSLTPEEVTSVVAYLLRSNEVSPNGIALTAATSGPVIPGFAPADAGTAPGTAGATSPTGAPVGVPVSPASRDQGIRP